MKNDFHNLQLSIGVMGSATYKNLGGHNAQVTTDKYSIEYILYTGLRILVREIISKTFYP